MSTPYVPMTVGVFDPRAPAYIPKRSLRVSEKRSFDSAFSSLGNSGSSLSLLDTIEVFMSESVCDVVSSLTELRTFTMCFSVKTGVHCFLSDGVASYLGVDFAKAKLFEKLLSMWRPQLTAWQEMKRMPYNPFMTYNELSELGFSYSNSFFSLKLAVPGRSDERSFTVTYCDEHEDYAASFWCPYEGRDLFFGEEGMYHAKELGDAYNFPCAECEAERGMRIAKKRKHFEYSVMPRSL